MFFVLLILAAVFWWLGTRAQRFGSPTAASLLRVGAAMMFMGPVALVLIGAVMWSGVNLTPLAWAAWAGQMIGGLLAAAGAFLFAVDAMKR